MSSNSVTSELWYWNLTWVTLLICTEALAKAQQSSGKQQQRLPGCLLSSMSCKFRGGGLSGASLREPPLFQVEFEDPNWAAPDLAYRGSYVNWKSPPGSFSGQTASRVQGWAPGTGSDVWLPAVAGHRCAEHKLHSWFWAQDNVKTETPVSLSHRSWGEGKGLCKLTRLSWLCV